MSKHEVVRGALEKGLYTSVGELGLHYGKIIDLKQIAESTKESLKSFDLYVHFPFCERICAYCPYHRAVASTSNRERYVQALETHIDETLSQFELNKNGKGIRVPSMYFGGGTPSMMTPEQTKRILDRIKSSVDLEDTEITFELHPADVTEEYIRALQDLGIKRFSIGVQNLSDSERVAIRRNLTDSETDLDKLKILNRLGVKYNVDLIYGTPSQDLQSWMETGRVLVETIRPPQITTYEYINGYRTGTSKMVARGILQRPSFGETHHFYRAAQDFFLKHGYAQTSNMSYDRVEDIDQELSHGFFERNFLGLGARAYSNLEDWYFINTAKWSDFLKEEPLINEYFGAKLPHAIRRLMDKVSRQGRSTVSVSPRDALSAELQTQAFQVLCYGLNQEIFPGSKQGKRDSFVLPTAA